jgi:hypothetical protein
MLVEIFFGQEDGDHKEPLPWLAFVFAVPMIAVFVAILGSTAATILYLLLIWIATLLQS